MKQPLFLILILYMTIQIGWTQNNAITIAYIAQYKAIAMKEMKRTGVPASITLAQAILESNSGESNLAKNHNNHFGIKCKSDWTGAKAYQDDDAKQECFRAYETAEISFKDHSNFLKNRPNYVDLFLLDPVDDTAWAYGLKKAGYATASDYPKKLLKIIDDYELAQYNFPELENEVDEEEEGVKTPSDGPIKKIPTDTFVKNTPSDGSLNKLVVDSPINKVITDTTVKSLNKPSGIAQMNTTNNVAPLPTKALPTQILPLQTLPAPQKDTIQKDSTKASTIAQPDGSKKPAYNYPEGQFRINQVPVILGKEKMSFIEIALKYKVPLYKLFEYNDIKASYLLEKDQLIFLAPKKKTGAPSFHIVKYNTSLQEISQLEGIQLSQLKLYNPQLVEPLKEGTQVILFNKKK
ncbi:MAG: glycoside hydrolase family 73 protein [Sediminibacterium sp.]